MPTTTIRIPDALKARISRAAAASGTNMHSFILEAISDKTDLAERRADFHSEADQRYEQILETGKTIGWNEMRRYMESRAAGASSPKPRARRLTRKA